MKWEHYPNLRRRPATPSKGRGRKGAGGQKKQGFLLRKTDSSFVKTPVQPEIRISGAGGKKTQGFVSAAGFC
jgi:hypothetical protein